MSRQSWVRGVKVAEDKVAWAFFPPFSPPPHPRGEESKPSCLQRKG